MAVIQAIDLIRPTIGIVKFWCESCFNGTHKSCEDHAADVALLQTDSIHEC
jgi:hypothetical protein